MYVYRDIVCVDGGCGDDVSYDDTDKTIESFFVCVMSQNFFSLFVCIYVDF